MGLDLSELEKLVAEAGKLENVSESTKQVKGIKDKLDKIEKEKDAVQKRLTELRGKIKERDLAREDPFTFTPLIREIKELGLLLKDRNNMLDQLE